MSHGLMEGMLLGGLLMSAIPLALGIGVALWALRRRREARAAGVEKR